MELKLILALVIGSVLGSVMTLCVVYNLWIEEKKKLLLLSQRPRDVKCMVCDTVIKDYYNIEVYHNQLRVLYKCPHCQCEEIVIYDIE